MTTTHQVSPFAQQVYTKLREVPAGSVVTYGDLARVLGNKSYRAIGQILHRNPFAPEVPCHRVVASDGSLGGFAFGLGKKIAMLANEGVHCSNGRVVDFESVRYRFQR